VNWWPPPWLPPASTVPISSIIVSAIGLPTGLLPAAYDFVAGLVLCLVAGAVTLRFGIDAYRAPLARPERPAAVLVMAATVVFLTLGAVACFVLALHAALGAGLVRR